MRILAFILTNRLILILFSILPVHSMINLFISKAEMDRTLGLSVELNYIENGVVNSYSVKFPYRINTNVSYVLYSWNTKVLDHPVYYAIRAISEDSAVLPILQIAAQGHLPLKTEAFKIEYRCAGNKAGKFGIALHFNFSWPSATNQTSVFLKQEKLCATREVRRAYGDVGDYDEFGNRMSGAEKHVSADNVFYLVVGCVGAVVLVIGLLLLVYYRSVRKAVPSDVEPDQHWLPAAEELTGKQAATATEAQPLVTAKATVYDASNVPSTSGLSGPITVPLVIYEKPQTIDLRVVLKELCADRNVFQILPVEELEGTFGEMKWAIWKQNLEGVAGDVDDEEDNACFEEQVVVKTLKSTADRRLLKKFLEDALAFVNVTQHNNLAHVDAIASYGRLDDPEQIVDFPLVCYRHQGFGNLKKFLISCRSDSAEVPFKHLSNSGIQTLRAHELVSMALQIMNAVVHLHSFGVIHKDIATRNCLVSEGHGRDRLHVQLHDSALSKDFFPGDYHCLGDDENRPVKWMAYESLLHNSFNSSTDVWSFGVTMWELLSCGQQPYVEVDPEQMTSVLQKGKRLSQPYNCPDELYGLMYCCWQLDCRDRPTGEQLLIALRDFNVQLLQYI